MVSRELGGEDGHRHFPAALQARGVRQVLDIVPNHMAIATGDNAWWRDVLENGPSSGFAAHFDVDWEPPEARMRNTVLIPVRGDHYGRVLDNRELALSRDGATFSVRYAEHRYPVDPRSLGPIPGTAARAAKSDPLAFMARAMLVLSTPHTDEGART